MCRAFVVVQFTFFLLVCSRLYYVLVGNTEQSFSHLKYISILFALTLEAFFCIMCIYFTVNSHSLSSLFDVQTTLFILVFFFSLFLPLDCIVFVHTRSRKNTSKIMILFGSRIKSRCLIRIWCFGSCFCSQTPIYNH